jgi:hypothetical protein
MGLGGWLKDRAEDVGGAVKDGVESVGDAVDEVGSTLEDVGDGAGSWIADRACSIDGDPMCAAGSFAGGLFSGLGLSLGGSVRITGRILVSSGSALGNTLQGRWKDALHDLGAVGIDAIVLGVQGLSSLGVTFDETLRHWQRRQLREFVSDLIDKEFEHDADRRRAAREATGVDRTVWGIRLDASHRLLAFDSYQGVDLAQLHDAGVIDLYALAGYTFPSDPTGNPWGTGLVTDPKSYPRALVQPLHGPDYTPEIGEMADREDIDNYLSTGTPGLRVLAMHPKYADRSILYASRICKDVGVRIRWQGTGLSHLQVRQEFIDNVFPIQWLGSTDVPAEKQRLDTFLFENGFRESCSIAAFGVLFPDRARRGVAFGTDIDDPSEPGFDPAACPTGNRDDNCCVTVESPVATVAYHWPRNATAPATAEFILAHEIGHWLGLCHEGHRRLTEIMYTIEQYPLIDKEYPFIPGVWSWASLGRGFQRPRFTGADGRNIWRFILDQRADDCLGVAGEPTPVE